MTPNEALSDPLSTDWPLCCSTVLRSPLL